MKISFSIYKVVQSSYKKEEWKSKIRDNNECII